VSKKVRKSARKTKLKLPRTVRDGKRANDPTYIPPARISERMGELAQLKASGWDLPRLSRVLSAKWGVSQRSVRRYHRAVARQWAIINESYRRDPEQDVAELRASFNEALMGARANNDPRAMGMILRAKAEALLPKRIDVRHAGPRGGAMEMTHTVDPETIAALGAALRGLPDDELAAFTRIAGRLVGRGLEDAGGPGAAPHDGAQGAGAPSS